MNAGEPTAEDLAVDALLEENRQLREALESRICIEQAKGILAERLRLNLDEAFELMRRTSRAERRRVQELAREVVEQPHTPAGILASLQSLLTRKAHAG